MKIIEAMKKIKANKEKVIDLQQKIATMCANLSHETPMYGTETAKKVAEWAQACDDISQDNVRLLVSIQKTNLVTSVSIELGAKQVTKSIAEWVWRRREYAAADFKTWQQMTDRGLKEGTMNSSTGVPFEVKIVRHFDPLLRDEKQALYRSESHLIDGALEVVNATTELIA